MDQIVQGHLSSTKLRFCVFSGNNAKLIKRQFENNQSQWEEVSHEDEKLAVQTANFIWRQNDLTTYTNGIWENINYKLKYNGCYLNKMRPVQEDERPELALLQPLEAKTSKQPSIYAPHVAQTHPVPILRVVNHLDNMKQITQKTTILEQLKNYYGKLKDRCDFQDNQNYQSNLYYSSINKIHNRDQSQNALAKEALGPLSSKSIGNSNGKKMRTLYNSQQKTATIFDAKASSTTVPKIERMNVFPDDEGPAKDTDNATSQEQVLNIIQQEIHQNPTITAKETSVNVLDESQCLHEHDDEIAQLILKQDLIEVFDILPTAFLLNPKQASELNRFKKRFSDLHIGKGMCCNEHVPDKHCRNNQWILKPAALNQGKGIQLFSKIREILKFLNEQPPDSQWVVQKYIEKPLLFKKRKFDIRMWVIIHAQDQPDQFDIHFFREGYLRTTSQEYDVHCEDLFVHLTNNCLQVQEKATFGQHEKGNTVSFDIFQKYLDEEYGEYNVSIEKDLLPRMKNIVIDTILSCKDRINLKQRKHCFELCGYDFLIDEDFRIWLLEVNNNPFLGYQNDDQYKILNHMISNIVQITLDPLLIEKGDPELNNKGPNDEYKENKFDLIYSDAQKINERGSFSRDELYCIPELNQNKSHEEKGKILATRQLEFNSQYRKKFEKKRFGSNYIYQYNSNYNYNLTKKNVTKEITQKLDQMAGGTEQTLLLPHNESVDQGILFDDNAEHNKSKMSEHSSYSQQNSNLKINAKAHTQRKSYEFNKTDQQRARDNKIQQSSPNSPLKQMFPGGESGGFAMSRNSPSKNVSKIIDSQNQMPGGQIIKISGLKEVQNQLSTPSNGTKVAKINQKLKAATNVIILDKKVINFNSTTTYGQKDLENTASIPQGTSSVTVYQAAKSTVQTMQTSRKLAGKSAGTQSVKSQNSNYKSYHMGNIPQQSRQNIREIKQQSQQIQQVISDQMCLQVRKKQSANQATEASTSSSTNAFVKKKSQSLISGMQQIAPTATNNTGNTLHSVQDNLDETGAKSSGNQITRNKAQNAEWTWNQSQSNTRKRMQKGSTSEKVKMVSKSIPAVKKMDQPRYMPLIQQKLPKLEVVQEQAQADLQDVGQGVEDLPEIHAIVHPLPLSLQ